MDDGYMVGPRDVIFTILAEFAERVERDTGCQLVPDKCKLYNLDETVWEDISSKKKPEILRHLKEGIYINNEGAKLRGVPVFNVPVGEGDYVAVVLRAKASQVIATK
jgi:hypothetical protein